MEAGPVAWVGCAWAVRVRSIERVIDVARHAICVCNGVGPVPWLILTPTAHTVDNWAAGVVESFRHGFVAVEGDLCGAGLTLVEAIVVLEVVYAVCKSIVSPSSMIDV